MNYLSDLEFRNAPDYTNGIIGWMSDNELKWLHLIAQKMESIVEIGCWKGRSTDALLSGCRGTVWAVDHFLGNEGLRDAACREAVEEDISKVFLANVGHYKNLIPLKMSSLEAARKFEDKSIDMVFIDAGHTYNEIKSDILAWLPKTKKIICGHDYRIEKKNNKFIHSDVRKAVDELLGADYIIPSIWIKLVDTK